MSKCVEQQPTCKTVKLAHILLVTFCRRFLILSLAFVLFYIEGTSGCNAVGLQKLWKHRHCTNQAIIRQRCLHCSCALANNVAICNLAPMLLRILSSVVGPNTHYTNKVCKSCTSKKMIRERGIKCSILVRVNYQLLGYSGSQLHHDSKHSKDNGVTACFHTSLVLKA